MNFFKQFISDNSEQIMTLISVVLGGLVTYFSTSAIEKRNNKMEAQKERMGQILVPYCTCIEETIRHISDVYIDNDLEVLLTFLKKPLEYLNAEKRIYLDRLSKEKLKVYKTNVEDFEKLLEVESDECLTQYRIYIGDLLQKSPTYGGCMNITFALKKDVKQKIKKALITLNDISLIDEIMLINLIYNDEPENFQSRSISIDEEVKDSLGMIECNVLSIDEIENDDVVVGCELLEYLEDNSLKEKEKLKESIDKTRSAILLRGINEDLQYMRTILIDEIDAIAN